MKKPRSSTIAETLRQARDRKGLSQAELGARVGLPQSHISKIESAGVDIKLSSLTELARALELELVLVPRNLVPAVESVIRGANPPTFRPISESKTIKQLRDVLLNLDRLYPGAPELKTLRALIEELAPFPLTNQDNAKVQQAIEELKYHLRREAEARGERKYSASAKDSSLALESLDAMRPAISQLQRLRNYLTHTDSGKAPSARPAYRLDEDEDDA